MQRTESEGSRYEARGKRRTRRTTSTVGATQGPRNEVDGLSGSVLRIAIVCDAVTDCLAGSFVSTQRFADLLQARGHTIVFITGRSPMNPSDGEHNGMKVYRFPALLLPKSEGQFYISFPTQRRLRAIFIEEKIQIVHAMIPTPSAVTATRAAQSLSIPVIVHSHTQPDNLFMHLPQSFLTRGLTNLFYKYMHWIYGKAHAVVHPSEFSRSKFTELTGPDSHVISNGVNASLFQKIDPSPFLTKFKIPRDRQRIVFVGRIHPEKDVETLIRAVPLMLEKKLNVHVIIVGFGHMEAALAKLVKKLGVKDRITMTGRVDDDDLLGAYSAADLFVLPSRAELEGMAVLEAMSVGAPVLIADSPESAARYFVDGNGALFRLGDAQHLADEATRILNNPELLEKMKAASLAKIKNYDIHRSVERLEELYRSFV